MRGLLKSDGRNEPLLICINYNLNRRISLKLLNPLIVHVHCCPRPIECHPDLSPCYDEWEGIIFSDSPDDLHELVTDGALTMIIKRLTPCQKEVLSLLTVHGYTAAELLGVSERNVHRLYATALYHIRGKIYPIIKFRRKLKTDEKNRELAIKRGYTPPAQNENSRIQWTGRSAATTAR